MSYPRAVALARESRAWAALSGPVIVVQATRCECGAWMRPGIDHTCAYPEPENTMRRAAPPRHAVTYRREPDGRYVVRCSCGKFAETTNRADYAEQHALRHLTNRR